MKRGLSLYLFLFSFSAAAASDPIPVKVTFLDALAPRDTTSSERFQKEVERALTLGRELTATRLAACGYSIETKTIFYSASDAIEALEKGKAAEKDGAWFLIGPRRSNHYVLLAQGAVSTPSVSTMASSQEVEGLGPLHLSIVASNKQMAKAAARETQHRFKKTKRPGYVSLVSEDCIMCLDFASHFDSEAKKLGLKKLDEVRIAGETPDFSKAEESIRKNKPSFVLLPNYSKVSAQTMNALFKINPGLLYVGGDGWGDGTFGFVQHSQGLNGVSGITARGFPPVTDGLQKFALGKAAVEAKKDSSALPSSGTGLAILKIYEGLTDLLCKSKPKSKDAFTNDFKKKGKRLFKSPWGVSIYELRQGNIGFSKMAGS